MDERVAPHFFAGRAPVNRALNRCRLQVELPKSQAIWRFSTRYHLSDADTVARSSASFHVVLTRDRTRHYVAVD
jgi:hypothetical protein